MRGAVIDIGASRRFGEGYRDTAEIACLNLVISFCSRTNLVEQRYILIGVNLWVKIWSSRSKVRRTERGKARVFTHALNQKSTPLSTTHVCTLYIVLSAVQGYSAGQTPVLGWQQSADFQYEKVLFGRKKVSLHAIVTVTNVTATEVLCNTTELDK